MILRIRVCLIERRTELTNMYRPKICTRIGIYREPPSAIPRTPPMPLSSRHLRSLEDLDIVNQPVGVGIDLWILRHILLARRCCVDTVSAAPNRTSPVPAERRIKHDVLVLEILVKIATRKVRLRSSPIGGIGVAGLDVSWNLVPDPEPDLDTRRSPLRSIDTTTTVIEWRTDASADIGYNGAAVVAASRATVLGCAGITGLSTRTSVHRAPRCGMQSDLVRGLEVDAFNDIDFAAVGPVRSVHPAARRSQ